MLRSINEVLGYTISAKDEDVGKVHNFYFNDEKWTIRYLVADTGDWLPGEKVLISAAGFYGKPDWENKNFSVVFDNKEQVKECPDVNTHNPVARQKEQEMNRARISLKIEELNAIADSDISTEDVIPKSEDKDPHLRSSKEVLGYHIHAKDGEIGHIDDFIIDDEKWDIRFIVVATRNILPGKKVLIPTMWVQKVSWKDAQIYIGLTKENIEKSPSYDPSMPINHESEGRLYDYYGRPKGDA